MKEHGLRGPIEVKGYRKVLIVMNESKEVLKQGIRLARDEKTWVTVLKVVPPYEGDLHLTGIKNLNDVLGDENARVCADICKIPESERTLVKTRVLVGDATDRIVAAAEEEQCDLIIMGTKKKKSFLDRLFGDHVVENVIDRAPCPVYVVGLSYERMPQWSSSCGFIRGKVITPLYSRRSAHSR